MNQPSKKAIWLATESPEGDRLLEIAREHLRLVKELPVMWPNDAYCVEREIVKSRIEQLRSERDAIIAKYEEKALDGVGAVQS